jgi:hypothetical protein
MKPQDSANHCLVAFLFQQDLGQANRDLVSVEMYYEYEDAQFSVLPLAFAHAVLSSRFKALSPESWVQVSLLSGKMNGAVSVTV